MKLLTAADVIEARCMVLLPVEEVAARLGCSKRAASIVIHSLPHLAVITSKPAIFKYVLNEWLASVRAQRPTSPCSESGVYFVADGANLKIGESSSVSRRIAALQKANPRALSLLAVFDGGPPLEAYYHGLFRDYRIHGEWFRREGALDAFLKKHGL